MNKPSKPAGSRPTADRAALLARIRADIAATTDEHDAAVTAGALADPDNLPDRFPKRMGRPKLENAKQSVALRLDPEVVERFKAKGPGWQTRMNDVLRKAVGL